MNRNGRTHWGLLPLLVVATTAAALAAAVPAAAGTIPAHDSPTVYCMNGGKMTADLPTRVSTPYRSEPISVRFHLLKKVYGVWQYQIADDHYFTNFATFGGALLGGWLPDGNSSIWGSYEADFYIKTAGEYRIAMTLKWDYSNVSTYEWVGYHVFSDPYNFIHKVGQSCDYR